MPIKPKNVAPMSEFISSAGVAGGAEGPSVCMAARYNIPIGGGGADDIAIPPMGFRYKILNAWSFILTAVAASTWAVRTATGGGGTLLGTLPSAVVGFNIYDASSFDPTAEGANQVVGAGQGIFLRRSNSLTRGSLVLLVVKV